MKNVLQKLEQTDSRIKCLLVVAFAYVLLMLGISNVEAMNTLDNYVPSVNIYIKDGASEPTGYLVKEGTVEDVLNQLGFELNEEDFTSVELTQEISEQQTLEINRITYEEEKTQEDIPYETINRAGNKSSISGSRVAQTGQNGIMENTFRVRYQNEIETGRELISAAVIQEPVSEIIESNTIAEGTAFTGRLTTFGGDCNGCSGRAASGVRLDGNGVNNSGSAKMNYNGGSYYALAADPSIPFGTIIEIRNHNLSLEPVIYGIVVDRGGAIKGNKIDIFFGLERGNRFFSGGTSNRTQFKIVSMGKGRI